MFNIIPIGLLIATSWAAISGHPLTVYNSFDNGVAAPENAQELQESKDSKVYHPLKFHSTRNFNDDNDAGYTKQMHESDKDGYHHRESFHKMDAGSFENMKNEGFGFSKTSENVPVKTKTTKKKAHYTKPSKKSEKYQVSEDFNEPARPINDKAMRKGNKNGGTQFGFIHTRNNKNGNSIKNKKSPKKPIDPKKTENYETIIYHETENGSSETGYKSNPADDVAESSDLPLNYEEQEAIRNADEEEYVEDGDDYDDQENEQQEGSDNDNDDDNNNDQNYEYEDETTDSSPESTNQNTESTGYDYNYGDNIDVEDNGEVESNNFDTDSGADIYDYSVLSDGPDDGAEDAAEDGAEDGAEEGSLEDEATDGENDENAEEDLVGEYTNDDNQQYLFASEADGDATYQ